MQQVTLPNLDGLAEGDCHEGAFGHHSYINSFLFKVLMLGITACMGWSFLLLLYSSSSTLTASKGHLCLLGVSPFLLLLCTKKKIKLSEKSCPNSREANLCLGDRNSNHYWHCWSWLEYSIHLVPWFTFCHWAQAFMDSLAMDHLCLNVICV